MLKPYKMQQAMSDPGKIQPFYMKIGKENSPRLVMLTVQQIVTDFGMFGYPIRYTGRPEEAHDQIAHELKLIVEELIKEGKNYLTEMLAKIGINEMTVEESINNRVNKSIAEAISALILETEFRKVYMKEAGV